jgi:H/ACA ribonucleoprotein complex subunit 3
MLVDAVAKFSSSHCWFFATVQQGPKSVNRCSVIDIKGNVVAYAEATTGDGTWLGSFRGHLPAGNFLMAATDNGLEQVGIDSGTLSVTKTFPDTEPFIDSNCQLFLSPRGLFVVDSNEVFELTMK